MARGDYPHTALTPFMINEPAVSPLSLCQSITKEALLARGEWRNKRTSFVPTFFTLAVSVRCLFMRISIRTPSLSASKHWKMLPCTKNKDPLCCTEGWRPFCDCFCCHKHIWLLFRDPHASPPCPLCCFLWKCREVPVVVSCLRQVGDDASGSCFWWNIKANALNLNPSSLHFVLIWQIYDLFTLNVNVIFF